LASLIPMKKPNTKIYRADALMLVTAIIWGSGFVAQRVGMEHVGPFAFNGIRFALGALVLAPLIKYKRNRPDSDLHHTPSLLCHAATDRIGLHDRWKSRFYHRIVCDLCCAHGLVWGL